MSCFIKHFALVLLLAACSQTGNQNVSGGRVVTSVEMAVFTKLKEIKKYDAKNIQVDANFAEINFNAQPPDDLRSYRLTHYFVNLVQSIPEQIFVLVPTSNTKINSLSYQDKITLEGVIEVKGNSICFFVNEIKRNSFTRK